MSAHEVLRIVGHGGWHGGRFVGNSIYEERGVSFKGGILATDETIQRKIGIKTRVVAEPGVKIGADAVTDLFENQAIDPSRVRFVIGPITTGEDKNDPGPQVRHSFEVIKEYCPGAAAFDLHAGCAGFCATVDLLLALSAAGVLEKDDLSVIIGAETIVRDAVFKPDDISGISFGDDAVATALETTAALHPQGEYSLEHRSSIPVGHDITADVAEALFSLCGHNRVDAIIIDNQLGRLELKMPACAARVQHRLVEMMFPGERDAGTFERFAEAVEFYDQRVRSFAFDIVSLANTPETVHSLGRAYVCSGRCQAVASVYLAKDLTLDVVIHRGEGFAPPQARRGIVDALTRTYGCFADVMRVIRENGTVVGDIQQRGVLLFATRGAARHLAALLSRNHLTLDEVDLLLQHQANFGIMLATLGQILGNGKDNLDDAVSNFIAEKVVTNINSRGNSSVVNVQRLAYDLQRGALREHVVQEHVVNSNADSLREARTILYDSVGAGMTRSSFIERR